jgi:hypothetical protein
VGLVAEDHDGFAELFPCQESGVPLMGRPGCGIASGRIRAPGRIAERHRKEADCIGTGREIIVEDLPWFKPEVLGSDFSASLPMEGVLTMMPISEGVPVGEVEATSTMQTNTPNSRKRDSAWRKRWGTPPGVAPIALPCVMLPRGKAAAPLRMTLRVAVATPPIGVAPTRRSLVADSQLRSSDR